MTILDVQALIAVQNRSYDRAGPGILESYPRTQSMDAARLAAFLDSTRYAVLATSRPDGRAQATPIAFTVWDGAFWVASVRGARTRNLRVHPYASIVVMEGEGTAHRAIIAEGPVTTYEKLDLGGRRDELWALWQARHRHLPDWATLLIELRPERFFSYDATGGVQAPSTITR